MKWRRFFLLAVTLIGTAAPNTALAMRPVIKTVAICQRLLHPGRGSEFVKWLETAKTLSRRGSPEPGNFMPLLRYSSALDDDERETVLRLISENYQWAKTNSKPLKRRYDMMLKFAMPESLYFVDLARKYGATDAYHLYLEHAARLHKGRAALEPELREMVRTLQDSLRLFRGRTIGTDDSEPFYVLGGSVFNGHGFDFDMDAAAYPAQVPKEPEIAQYLKENPGSKLQTLLDRLDDRVYQGQLRSHISDLWTKESLLNLRQPFAVLVKPDKVILIHFIPTTLLTVGENPKVKFKEYDLDW